MYRRRLAGVAVKISPTVVVHSACKEMTALTRLDHPHIVRLLGVQALHWARACTHMGRSKPVTLNVVAELRS